MRSVLILCVLARIAAAQPVLDEFYERTRARDEGFGDNDHVVQLLVGAETANPSTDMLEPHLASGLELGVDLGIKRPKIIARTQLWADILRVHETGDWFTDLSWHSTVFKAYGRPRDDEGMHLALDTLVARRNEITPSDVAELQLGGYDTVDVEGEAVPVLPMIDNDANLVLPIGAAARMRWNDTGGFELRTSYSMAIAARKLVDGVGRTAQLDFLRVKHTEWNVGDLDTGAWTISAGYQHLPEGVDTLPIWALVGYEWAGITEGAVFQFGGTFKVPDIDITPSYERHFELDHMTGSFAVVDSAKLDIQHHIGPLAWGLAAESISIRDHGHLRAVTPEVGVLWRGFQVVGRFRIADTENVTFPTQRFSLGIDWVPKI